MGKHVFECVGVGVRGRVSEGEREANGEGNEEGDVFLFPGGISISSSSAY